MLGSLENKEPAPGVSENLLSPSHSFSSIGKVERMEGMKTNKHEEIIDNGLASSSFFFWRQGLSV